MKLTHKITAVCLLSSLPVVNAATLVETRSTQESFSFALIADMPYGDAQITQLNQIIKSINGDKSIEFVMHAGDIKSGGSVCDNKRILASFDQFQQFERAFIYTPGDNEWTDCHRIDNGSYYPLERLDYLRSVFFPAPTWTTGKNPIQVAPQSAAAGFDRYVENIMFSYGQVVFSTIHVVGSVNGLAPWSGFDPNDTISNPRPDRLNEVKERENAALSWIDATFDAATAANARGVFIMMQANPRFDLDAGDIFRTGFNAIIDKLRLRAAAFKKPVVLAHGDFHEYLVDKPFDILNDNPRIENFTRIQAFGAPRTNWVKVRVKPKSSNVFIFEQKIFELEQAN